MTNLTLTYDPEGRLSSYTSGSSTKTFLYDGVNLIAEYDGSGAMLKRYMHLLGDDKPWVEFAGSGVGASNATYLYTNYQGSIIANADMGGNVNSVYKYGPYGEPKNAANADDWSTTGQRFRYTGQIMLPEARLYYYKARVYDPMYGRFLQTDPIGSKDDLDLYAYVKGDPINRGDPTGLCGGGRSVKDDGKPCDYTKNTHNGRAYQPPTKPKGDAAVAIGGTASIVVGVPFLPKTNFKAQVAVGVVTDGKDTKGYLTVGGGPYAASSKGANGLAGLINQVASAGIPKDDVFVGVTATAIDGKTADFGGAFSQNGGSIGAGEAIGGDLVSGRSADDTRDIHGASVSVGAGRGVDFGHQETYTWLTP